MICTAAPRALSWGVLCFFFASNWKVLVKNGEFDTNSIELWRRIRIQPGRRTFICLALSSGIPPQVVMKWTGHCDYKSMKPYIDIAGKTKSDAMNTFSNSLSF